MNGFCFIDNNIKRLFGNLNEQPNATNIFSEFFSDFASNNWVKKEDFYEIVVNIPGYEKSEIEMSVIKDRLLIKANNEKQGETQFRISLPNDINSIDEITSKLKLGQLIINVKSANNKLKINWTD